MRTPVVMIIGMVLAPCGLVLNLTSTVGPDWRQLSKINGMANDIVLHQGIWDICQETATNHNNQCGQTNPQYFSLQVVHIARALMITSLVVTVLGIVLASLGVRCWQDVPNYLIAGLGGVVIFISGVLSLIPISWYTNDVLKSSTDFTVQAGYALVLGYLGSCFEIIGGFSLALSLVHTCNECIKRRRKSTTTAKYYSKKASSVNPPSKINIPSTVYNTREDKKILDHYSTSLGYSVGNENYHHGKESRHASSTASMPNSHNNPGDGREGDHGLHRPVSQLSYLPCDSDLL
ncbi:claudin-23 [Rhinophrynus dorsalis]